MIRAVIVSATIAALICLWLDRPKPVEAKSASYCWITYKAAGKDQAGKWHSAWVQGYGPCSQLDRYENV